MAHPIPAPHASVALPSRRKRSHSKLDRTLAAIGLASIVAVTASVVVVTNDNSQVISATKASPAVQPQTPVDTRYDGGPEEGSRGPQPLQFKERAGGPTMIPQGPGAR
jgi:hypothetical protein